jgi:hypothetical protein
MNATVEHIRNQIDRLAPDEARELLLDLQRRLPPQLDTTEASSDTEDASAEAAWDAEIEVRLRDVAEGKVQLLTAEESERQTAMLFERLGIARSVRK